ncbi:MAG TPA: cyclic pyranopterin monophosphate synthase MoaC [Deltaproteobacteria bacterium]|nr:MAG: molybdenum cofactor biosynthesis protein C [Deltaproteobacteria bacterium GWA2_55_82]OGQ63108.1 MAG: molybdenum cofactor biosynthesis protein C [Deltaproteobacteria bacterium RIFCSPLOWO2_02_FULL_55_12]OIJ73570.1 MAG: molybdenum cofactor biosynthesis protein C [Deltaproteobacteria bacterium GWC2_55_46]HBG47703.1 cyclic pyranopterin monophosphate synthase MoaC [Deltaproteobacteria bacterium]HCY12075.1 cyclic pyranopterin monophosphate synthase MoaC [Deltaproteobacteria bacterium]
MGLTHIDERGKARMVDVTAKDTTERVATARGRVLMKKETLDLIVANEVKKGDVLGVARVAGIMAAKRTGELIPLCHPLNVTSVAVEFSPASEPPGIDITATAKVSSQTGVEMEALVAASVAALTIYDMCKAADKEMTITDIRLVKKTGGKSGTFMRKGETLAEETAG